MGTREERKACIAKLNHRRRRPTREGRHQIMSDQAVHQQREINRPRRHLVKVGELPRLSLAAARDKSGDAPDLAMKSIGSFVCALAVPFRRHFPSSIGRTSRRCQLR